MQKAHQVDWWAFFRFFTLFTLPCGGWHLCALSCAVTQGYYLNGEMCASGTIIISEKAKLEKQIAKVQKIQEIITKRNDNHLTVLKSGDEHSIEWTNKKFKMQMWDSAIEDNDRMSVIINGEKILSNPQTFLFLFYTVQREHAHR